MEDKTGCANMLAKWRVLSSAWLQIKHATYQMETLPYLCFFNVLLPWKFMKVPDFKNYFQA